jgi:hypothetical protein
MAEAAENERNRQTSSRCLPIRWRDHRGVRYAGPRPAPRHARASSVSGGEIEPPFGRGGPGGWVVLFEPEIPMGPGPDVVVRERAGWRRERMPELPDESSLRCRPTGPAKCCRFRAEARSQQEAARRLPPASGARVARRSDRAHARNLSLGWRELSLGRDLRRRSAVPRRAVRCDRARSRRALATPSRPRAVKPASASTSRAGRA